MKYSTVLQGCLALSVPLVFCMGCKKKEDVGSYQTYSDLTNSGEKSTVKASGEKNPPPAVAEKIDQPAIAQASYQKAAANKTQVAAKPPVREIKLLVPNKTFSKADREGSLRVSYDDIDLLKVLNMDPVPLDATEYLPGWLENLDGQKVRIRGFMYPAYQETGLRSFVLAKDNQICCFGRNPKVYDLIKVAMREGTTTDYLPNRPFDVVGTFHIVPPDPDETVLFRLYEIRDAAVITSRSR